MPAVGDHHHLHPVRPYRLPEIKRTVVAIGVRVSSFSLAVLLPNSLSLMEVIKLNMKDFLNSRRFCFRREILLPASSYILVNLVKYNTSYPFNFTEC